MNLIESMKKRERNRLANVGADSSSCSDNWLTMHDCCKEFRTKHHITIAEFLNRINLENRSSYVQYLSAGGRTVWPSRKEGTMGVKLREAIYNNVLNGDLVTSVVPSRPSTTSLVSSLVEEYLFDPLNSDVKNIQVVVCEQLNIDLLKVSVVVAIVDEVNKSTILEAFQRKFVSHLENVLQVRCDLLVTRVEILRAIHSPQCINVNGLGPGTSTILQHPRVTAEKVGITAKHVLAGLPGEAIELGEDGIFQSTPAAQ